MFHTISFMLIMFASNPDYSEYDIGYFGAEDCAPCQKMKKESWTDAKVKEILKKYKKRKSRKNDEPIWNNREDFSAQEWNSLIKKWKIEAIPTTIISKDGKEVSRKVGFVSGNILFTFLRDLK